MTDLTSSNYIGNVILAQLGGGKWLRLMIGARDFYTLSANDQSSGGLQFNIPSNLSRPRINKIIIRLNAADTYDVTFLNIRHSKKGYVTKTVAEEKDIYNDGLIACIERNTGLYLSMVRVKAKVA